MLIALHPMMLESARQKRIAVLIVCLSVAAGAWLRLSGLDTRGISHPEMYVPGILLPEGISEPAQRTTVTQVLTGTFSSDTHPPGYYLFMFPWTKALGTSLAAIRVPSALLGIACIAMVYAIGAVAGAPLAGAAAAALLALSGPHIFWSQVARMFTLECFLGLASTLVLMLVLRGSPWGRFWKAAYVALILAGLATHVFFWTLLATHIIWAFLNSLGQSKMPEVCRAQMLAMILGSPLIAFAAYQSSSTVALMSRDALEYLAEFVGFAFVLPTQASGFFPSAVPFTGGVFWIVRAAVILLGALLLMAGAAGLRRLRQQEPAAEMSSSPRRRWLLAWIAAGLLGTSEVGAFLSLARRLPPDQLHETIKLTQLLAILPLILTFAAVILEWNWSRLPRLGSWHRFFQGERALVTLLAFLPFLMLAAVSQLRPFLNQRGLLFAGPYLLLVAAFGLVSLKPRWALPISALLAITFCGSVAGYRQMMVDPADYAQFAASLKSQIQPRDLVFIRKAWNQTPILYYLYPQQYRLVGRDFASACTANPDAKVWVVLLYEADATPEMQKALGGYEAAVSITAPHARAVLYQPPNGAVMAARR